MQLLLEQIRELGSQRPEAPAITFVDDHGEITESMSRADLVTDMGTVADFLRQRCDLVPGDRAVLVYPPGLDFVRSLIGCIAAGVLPVAVYPPDPLTPHTSMKHLQRVAADCGARAVLTNQAYADARQFGSAESAKAGHQVDWPTQIAWHITPSDRPRDDAGFAPPRVSDWNPGPEVPAFLQYTSGSTSAPKGIIVTHANLAHQMDFLHRNLRYSVDSRAVLWLPV